MSTSVGVALFAVLLVQAWGNVFTLIVMAVIVQFVKIPVAGKPTGIAAQWLIPIGVIVTLAVGWATSRFHEPPEPVELPDADEAVVSQAA